MSRKVILTGASGWFGKVALKEYEDIYGPEELRENMLAIASTSKEIDFGSEYGTIRATALDQLDDSIECKAIIHFAFLTREKINKEYLDDYIEKNREITSKVGKLLLNNPKATCITTSSGAANNLGKSIKEDPYGFLKREEENIWENLSKDKRLAVVFRVYAASGRYMKNPKIFALGEFIIAAKSGKQITIRSKCEVIRSFINIGFLTRLIWKIVEEPWTKGFFNIDACTDKISLLELADIISSQWNIQKPNADIDLLLRRQDYSGDSMYIKYLAKLYSVKVPTIVEQIIETSLDISAE